MKESGENSSGGQNIHEKNQRNSAIELLRIVAMLLITFHHFAVHGGFVFDPSRPTIPEFWYNLIIIGGKIGVDVFILITGYFLITSKKPVSIKRLLKFWGPIVFYSIAIYLLAVLFGLTNFQLPDFIRSFFPLSLNTWWFASTYFLLYLFHPFLNTFLTSLKESTYRQFLILSIVLWSILPTFLNWKFPTIYDSGSLVWFITLYAIAGYIRLHVINKKPTKKSLKTKDYLLLTLIFTDFTYFLSLAITFIGVKHPSILNYTFYFNTQHSITILAISIFLFMTFATMTLGYHRWINTIASATFGVYLLHDHALSRPFLWQTVFHNASYANSLRLIPYSIGVVLLVYTVCTLIDLLRQRLIKKLTH